MQIRIHNREPICAPGTFGAVRGEEPICTFGAVREEEPICWKIFSNSLLLAGMGSCGSPMLPTSKMDRDKITLHIQSKKEIRDR